MNALFNSFSQIRVFRFFLFILIFNFLPQIGSTQIDDSPLQFLGSWEEGSGRSIAAEGDYIFVNSGNVLKIFNNSDLENLQLIATYNAEGLIYDILYSGDKLYIASSQKGIEILDISNIESPTLLSFLELDYYSPKLAKKDNYLFVSVTSHIFTVDLEDSSNPVIINDFELYKKAFQLRINGNWLYGARGSNGYFILDITDPESPGIRLDQQVSESYIHDIALNDQIVYLVKSDSLEVYDISNLVNPVKTYADYNKYGLFTELVNTDTLIVYESYSNAKIYDIQEPLNPTLLFQYNLPSINRINDCYLDDHSVYAISEYTNMSVFNFETPDSHKYNTYNAGPGFSYGSHMSDSHIFINNGGKGYGVYSFEDFAHPQYLGNFLEDGISNQAIFLNDKLYSCKAGLHIFDLSVPTDPVEIGILDFTGTIYNTLIMDDLLYVADYSNGLRIIDISDATTPVQVSIFNPDANCVGVDVQDNLAIIACRKDGLIILDVSNPLLPIEIGNLSDIGNCSGVKIKGEVAYVFRNSSTCLIVDIADPSNPIKMEDDLGNSVKNILLHENFAFVSAQGFGLQLLDVTDERNPVILDVHKTTVSTQHCSFLNDKICIADFFSGFEILSFDPLSPTRKPASFNNQVQIAPNPFDDIIHLNIDIDFPATGNISLLSNDGKLVYQSTNVSFSAGQNHRKIHVPDLNTGIYMLHLQSEKFSYCKKLIKH